MRGHLPVFDSETLPGGLPRQLSDQPGGIVIVGGSVHRRGEKPYHGQESAFEKLRRSRFEIGAGTADSADESLPFQFAHDQPDGGVAGEHLPGQLPVRRQLPAALAQNAAHLSEDIPPAFFKQCLSHNLLKC